MEDEITVIVSSCVLQYHLIVERRFLHTNDLESYAGGSISSW
jgi:hypothetical protein